MRKLGLLCCIFLLCSCGDDDSLYNGYIDADMTYLSSDYAGRLIHLFVVRGQAVQKNQRLFKLEQTNEKFGVDISEFTQKNLLSQRQQILAQIHYNEINHRRTLEIRKQDAASQNDLDLATKDLDVLKNQLAALDFQIKGSQVDTAEKQWQVARKENYATDSGIIFDTYFTEGEYAQAGQPIVSLITANNIKVIFFVSEKKLSKLQLNHKINILTDGNVLLGTGTIRYISNTAQYTPPIIFSREDRQSLIFRVEARLDKPNLNQVHLGQPVSLRLA